MTNVLFALVAIVFVSHDGGPATADLQVIDRLTQEDCMSELAKHDPETDAAVWACTPDYDY